MLRFEYLEVDRLHTAMRLAGYLFVVLLSLTACDTHDLSYATPAPAGSTVEIVGISPSTDELLHQGQRVRLSVKVAYKLIGKDGLLGIVVQDASNDVLAISEGSIAKGTGNQDFAVDFTVPETTDVQLFVPLSAKGQNATRTVTMRTYKVATN
jgi:hypothetical protein